MPTKHNYRKSYRNVNKTLDDGRVIKVKRPPDGPVMEGLRRDAKRDAWKKR